MFAEAIHNFGRIGQRVALTITCVSNADLRVSRNILSPFIHKLKRVMDFIPMNIILYWGGSVKGQAL